MGGVSLLPHALGVHLNDLYAPLQSIFKPGSRTFLIFFFYFFFKLLYRTTITTLPILPLTTVSNYYHYSTNTTSTRAHLGLKLRTITVTNNKYYRSIYNRAAEAWNKLDLNVRNIRDRDTFNNTIVRMFGNRYTEN